MYFFAAPYSGYPITGCNTPIIRYPSRGRAPEICAMRLNSSGKYEIWKDVPPEIKTIYDQVILNLTKAGARIIYLDLPKFNNDRSDNMAGTVEDISAYLATHQSRIKNFNEICTSDKSKIVGTIANCIKFVNSIPRKDSAKYQQVLAMINKNQQYVMNILNQKHIDGILLPISKTGISTYDGKLVNTWQAPISSNTGLPSIAIYVSNDKNHMPIGVEIVGKKYHEGELLGFAYAYEQKYAKFKAPTLVATDYFESWSITKLNELYLQIGKNSYTQIIKPKNKTEITDSEATKATNQAIKEIM